MTTNIDVRCPACNGVGKVVPPGQDLSVMAGVIRPRKCQECGGTGVKETGVLSAATGGGG
jgi:hypothetical protein